MALTLGSRLTIMNRLRANRGSYLDLDGLTVSGSPLARWLSTRSTPDRGACAHLVLFGEGATRFIVCAIRSSRIGFSRSTSMIARPMNSGA